MKIIVPISIVPDIYYPVENHTSATGVNVPDVYLDINPLDKQTLGCAMSLCDDVEVVHVGDTPRDKALRYTIAMGVNNVTHIHAQALDAYTTATHISCYVKDRDYDIIMCSNASWDYASGQTAEYLSELLGVPLIRDVSHIEKDSCGKIHITCSHSDCVERIKDITTPVILSCDKSIFPAESVKIPSMRDMMLSMRQAINNVTSTVNPKSHATYSNYAPAKSRPMVKMMTLDDIEKITDILLEEHSISIDERGGTVSLFSGRVEASVSITGNPCAVPYPITGEKTTLPAHRDLKDSPVIISGGMGCTDDDWVMIDKIASHINAAVGCTRPVFHSGKRPYYQHIGQTGTRVKPRVYIALGISGALQHIGGMMKSGVVIAVNTDPTAAIFSYSDYGIIASAGEFLAALEKSLTDKI
jgi:electron transfer flavoprotein alpha subunit